MIDSYADTLVNILLDCAHSSIPSISSTPRRLAGWNDSPSELRRETNFWHKVWEEAGCPSSVVLFNIKKNAESRYRYAVSRIKRRQNHLVRNKLTQSFTKKRKNNFWSVVKGLAKSHKPTCAIVDSGGSRGGKGGAIEPPFCSQ